MPRYGYECENTACGVTFDFVQKMSDEKLVDCPKCNEPKLNRLPSAGVGPVFKGIFPGQDHIRMSAADKLIEKAKIARKIRHYGLWDPDEKIKESDIDLSLPDELPTIPGPPVIPGPPQPCAEPT